MNATFQIKIRSNKDKSYPQNLNMKAIDRKQAEELLLSSEVIKSQINQDKNEICLKFKLINGKTILMKYRIPNYTKSYYIV